VRDAVAHPSTDSTRFAGALVELGVRPGEVVALQLPNWWQAGALILAVDRVGAVLTLIPPNIRSRELERVLAGTGSTPGTWLLRTGAVESG
jgi:acyl-coenzyme A synthetase/AMP-(fatty) acid ligase